MKMTFTLISSRYLVIFATRNVTKNWKRFFLLYSPRFSSILPLEMSQKIGKNYFPFFVTDNQEFCHWKCNNKFSKKYSSIIVFHPNVLQNSHWKCNKNSKELYSFLLVCCTQMYSKIATENVTKIQKILKYSYWCVSPKRTPK